MRFKTTERQFREPDVSSQQHRRLIRGIGLYLKGDEKEQYRSDISARHYPALDLTYGQSICHIRMCSHQLDPLDTTFLQDLELIDLKGEIATKLRTVQQLQEELNTWKKKTSPFLNGNRILEDLARRFPKLKHNNSKQIAMEITADRENISKHERKNNLRQSYQDLFYHLQTNPKYLLKLMCKISEAEFNGLAEEVLHRLYNYASTPREEYHLVKYLETALQYEVENFCTDIDDILNGRSKIIKTIFSFYRQDKKCNAILQKLAPVIQEIVNYTIGDECEVMDNITGKIIQSIFLNVDSLPYGIRYIAKVLRQALQKEFPGATEDNILKNIVHFIYLYCKPAIEALIDKLDSCSPQEKPRVCLVTHQNMWDLFFPVKTKHATIKDDDSLKEYPSFCSIFLDVFKIPEPEEEFGFNKYSDIRSPTTAPVITLTAMDILIMHELLLKYKEDVIPDRTDILYKILNDLGSVHSVHEFVGEDLTIRYGHEAFKKTKIHLSIRQCIPQDDYDMETETLRVTTSKLIRDIICIQPGETLWDVLTTPASPKQKEEHAAMIKNTTMSTTNAPRNTRESRIVEDHHLPLEAKKRKILTNLQTLQDAQGVGLLKPTAYQDILNKIVQNSSRKLEGCLQQTASKRRLRESVDALEDRSNYYQYQIDQCKMFWNNRLEHIVSHKSENTSRMEEEDDDDDRTWLQKLFCLKSATNNIKKLKYTPAQLQRKGVIVGTYKVSERLRRDLLKIEIIANHQIKVSQSKRSSLLDIDDILELHYSGIETLDILGYNVRLMMLLFMMYTK